jgi:ABC-type bacteriocin/lantibiotic exporter with double-glycine peptidase domain
MSSEPAAKPPDSGSAEPPSGRRVLKFSPFAALGARRRTRVPVILQLTPTDCGAACLAMTLEHFGAKLPIDEIRLAVGSGKLGVNAKSIVEAARGFGLRARAVKVDPDKLKFLGAGSILHWEMNHFVVFESVQRGYIRVIDPAVGPRRIPLADVGRMLTGVAMVFEPTLQLLAEDKRPKTRWARYKRWIFGVPGYWPRILAASLALQIVALAAPGLMGVTVDKIVPRQDYHLLQLIAAGVLMIASFQFLAGFLRGHLLLHLRTYIDAEMALELLEHLLDLPYAFFQQRSAGDILMRLGSGSQIRELLTSGAMAALLDGTLVIVYFVLLVIAAPLLGVVALGIAIVQGAVFVLVGRRNAELMAEQLATQAKLSGFQVEMLAGIESVKSMGAEERMTTRWAALYVDTLNISLEKGRLLTSFSTLVGSFSFLGPISLVMLGAKMVLDGELSLGSMLALAALGSGFLGPVNTLVSTAMQLQLLSGFMARIEDVLDSPTDRRREASGRGKRLTGALELSRVSFRYDPKSALVVDDVSFSVAPGELVAIVGASGSGKSTLARLLAGLYRPISGRVAYDGVPLEQWDPPELRRQLGMVTQDTRLFGATVRDNIAMLDPEVPLDRVEAAARIAHIHEDVMELPMGYDTLLADGGTSLSGGQRQRIALSRALLMDPVVMVLDEATSALDTVTERKIQGELKALRCTRIVIAHRLSTVVDADRIIVLERGKVLDIGPHTELVERCPTYRALVQAQVK